jgi:hypothetical protein
MKTCFELNFVLHETIHSLVEIDQNITTLFTTTCDYQSFTAIFRHFCNYFLC